MNRIVKRIAALALSAALFSVPAFAADITSSVSEITLNRGESDVVFDVILKTDTPFAGAEFGLLPSNDDVEFKSVTFSDELKNEPTVQTVKDGCLYFGFFSNANKYEAGTYTVAEVHYTYSGSGTRSISLESSKIVTIDEENNRTEGDTSSLPFTVTIERKSNSGGSGGSSGGGGSYTSSSYTVTFDSQGGSHVDSVQVSRNQTVTQPATPVRDGYIFEGWYTDSACTQSYDFDTKVTQSFTLYAKWTIQSSAWDNPFTDVRAEDWFYDNVKYVYENNLFSGVSDTLFAPGDAMTRAMLVTVLHRAEGEPAAADISGFTDVPADAYYAQAVAWASQNEIVKGMDAETFAPDTPVSREQIAAILERYADFKGLATEEAGDLTSFIDATDVSEWATGNVTWAVGAGLLNGRDDGTLDPLGNATRAEVAAMLQRFLENVLTTI